MRSARGCDETPCAMTLPHRTNPKTAAKTPCSSERSGSPRTGLCPWGVSPPRARPSGLDNTEPHPRAQEHKEREPAGPRAAKHSLPPQLRLALRPTLRLLGIPASCCCDLVYRGWHPNANAALRQHSSHIGVSSPAEPIQIPGPRDRSVSDLPRPLPQR
jgi:hypothetical protein